VHVRRLNLARRHLTEAQHRQLIREELREDPQKSSRHIAEALQCRRLLARLRERMESIRKFCNAQRNDEGRSLTSYPRKKASCVEATGVADQQAITAGAKKIKRDRRAEPYAKRRARAAATLPPTSARRRRSGGPQ
jgi:hypothetical protein